jgi:hypothetical protein
VKAYIRQNRPLSCVVRSNELIKTKVIWRKDKAFRFSKWFYAVQSDEYDYGINWKMAKQCAIILVEVIKTENDCKRSTVL